MTTVGSAVAAENCSVVVGAAVGAAVGGGADADVGSVAAVAAGGDDAVREETVFRFHHNPRSKMTRRQAIEVRESHHHR